MGVAPVGVIAMCRPGVMEDEKTDKLRARMFPTTHKNPRFGGNRSDRSHRGFLSLLRPIDDELSLTATASDDNDNSDGEGEGDVDSSGKEERNYAEQEQGPMSPTSRYPPSATSPKKGGGSLGGTHLPEFSNGNGGMDSNFNSNSRQVSSDRCTRNATTTTTTTNNNNKQQSYLNYPAFQQPYPAYPNLAFTLCLVYLHLAFARGPFGPRHAASRLTHPPAPSLPLHSCRCCAES